MSSRAEKTDPSFFEKKRGNILCFIKECISDPMDSSDQESDAAMAVLLDRYLDAAVIVDRRVAGELPGVLRHVYEEVCCQTRRSIGRYLLDPGTPLSVLEEIKEHHQQLAKSSPSKAEHHVATAVYFAAIASAIVFHQEKITSYSPSKLREAVGKLLGKAWMNPELRSLFEQANKTLAESTRSP